jgi:hypothetical protein
VFHGWDGLVRGMVLLKVELLQRHMVNVLPPYRMGVPSSFTSLQVWRMGTEMSYPPTLAELDDSLLGDGMVTSAGEIRRCL